MRKLKDEVKTQFLAALRSGDYQQGQLKLRPADDKYCCLGVLCDLAVKASVPGVMWTRTSDGEWIVDGQARVLPFSVIHWAFQESQESEESDPIARVRPGHEENPYITVELDDTTRIRTSLAEMNDSNKTFEVIAQHIEDQL